MNGNSNFAIFNLLSRRSTLSSHFLYDIPEVFEKKNYRINFVVYNCKVNIEIEIARDVDNLRLWNSL
jgi:hypothetical protein